MAPPFQPRPGDVSTEELEVGRVTPINVGIVGCGEVVQIIHLPALYQLPDQFRVTALSDVSATVLDAVGGRWGIERRYVEYRRLLDDPGVDAVLVASPHALHTEIAVAAIEAGKHVLVEKPMAMTVRETDEIIAAQRQHRVTVQVGYMRRHASAYRHAQALLREHRSTVKLARVHAVIGRNPLFTNQVARTIRGQDVPDAAVQAVQRRQADLVREAIGTADPRLTSTYLMLLGLSSHDISAMRGLLGRPSSVLYAAQRQDRYVTAAFDYGTFVCHFETGTDAIPRFDAHLEVYLPERVLRVEYDTPYVRHLPTRIRITEANGDVGVAERLVQPDWDDPFLAEWRTFHDNITRQLEPATSPTDFREDLELFLEMIRLIHGSAAAT
jgi:predicted dehydrogenase